MIEYDGLADAIGVMIFYFLVSLSHWNGVVVVSATGLVLVGVYHCSGSFAMVWFG